MNEELENQFYFLRNFIVEGFENYKIDKILICENLKDKSVIFVYLKMILEPDFGKILKQ